MTIPVISEDRGLVNNIIDAYYELTYNSTTGLLEKEEVWDSATKNILYEEKNYFYNANNLVSKIEWTILEGYIEQLQQNTITENNITFNTFEIINTEKYINIEITYTYDTNNRLITAERKII